MLEDLPIFGYFLWVKADLFSKIMCENGTKLKITGVEKYVLWNHGPTSEEWIERGFPLPKDKSRSVRMNIST